MTFAQRVLRFYNTLEFTGKLPSGVRVMNPFHENPEVTNLATQFYTRYYDDNSERFIVLGINPGRFGAGATGIPFTDTIRLNEKCGIQVSSFRTYEPSSSFIYEMIEAYGGVEIFYKRFFVSAICPLGFTKNNQKNGKPVNYNYYDSAELTSLVYSFIVNTLEQQLEFGINRERCFCLGTGKNDSFLRKLNAKYNFFKSITTLEHPRYIMQYKAAAKDQYIRKYADSFRF